MSRARSKRLTIPRKKITMDTQHGGRAGETVCRRRRRKGERFGAGLSRTSFLPARAERKLSEVHMITHGNEIKLFAGNSNRPLAEAIAKKLNTELGGVEVGRFSDGETAVHIDETVRGRDLFIIQ